MTFGIQLIVITILGYISHTLNQKFLSAKILSPLYYIGAAVHELSHACMCVLTGARVRELHIFSREPRVIHTQPRLPFLGQPLISLAPLFGGLLFLFLINRWLFDSWFSFAAPKNLAEIILFIKQLFAQLKLSDFRTYVWLLLTLNSGSMLGPSWQDLKSIWPFLIISLFITWSPLVYLGLVANALLLTNIIIQVMLIILRLPFRKGLLN